MIIAQFLLGLLDHRCGQNGWAGVEIIDFAHRPILLRMFL
jgi:hypothetical protein